MIKIVSFKQELYNNPNIEDMKYVTNLPLINPITAYRGNKIDKPIPVGSRFTDLGFTGTSLNSSIARFFSRKNRPTGKIFAIHMPIGTRAYKIDNHTTNTLDDEDELLLHPENHFETIGHTNHPDAFRPYYVTHLALTGQGNHSLISNSEGRDWLHHIKNNFSNIV